MSSENNFKVKKERPEDQFDDVREYYQVETLLNYANSKNMKRIQEKQVGKYISEALQTGKIKPEALKDGIRSKIDKLA